MSEDKSVEAKLGDLMMQGWTMLADACFKESCQTPLMRDNVSKQIYCCGCEAWVCSKERRLTGKKFNELVSLEGKRIVSVKDDDSMQLSKLDKKPIVIEKDLSFTQILEKKLIEFSDWLEKEQDPKKCNEILDAIKKTMDILENIHNHSNVHKK